VKITCPECAKEIPLADTNPSTDVALCRACEKNFSFADLANDAEELSVDLTRPPAGTWVRELGGGFEVGTTTRNASAFFLVPFTAIWSGGSLGGIYGSQIYKGHFDWKISLFGIPFLLGSMFLIPAALMAVCGKIIVRGAGDTVSISTGIGPLCFTRRFRWSEIKRVHETLSKWQQNNRNMPLIELVREGKPIGFGSQLSEPRRKFLLAMLKSLHTAKR
jgi:hypothetical protein